MDIVPHYFRPAGPFGPAFKIDADMMEGLRDYVGSRLRPGSFLSAVIANDLKEAVARADLRNIGNLPAFVDWLYNYAPAACWGSREKLEAWLSSK